MKQTSNYGLKKPEGQDVVNIDDLNYNADILDTQLKSLSNNLDTQIKNLSNSKVDKVQGKQLSTEDYSTSEKQKLLGIEQGANRYSHPTTHPASMITGLPTSLPANGGNSDTVGGKKPSDFADKNHTHTMSQITDFKEVIDSRNIYSTFKINKDDNGIFTTIQVKRRNGTIYLTSVLSGGSSPRYTTRIVTEYADNGTTVVKTIKYNLSYDGEDNLISEVLQ